MQVNTMYSLTAHSYMDVVGIVAVADSFDYSHDTRLLLKQVAVGKA